ncbi:MAG TPA: Hsp20/alpha crystallin family protein [Puia sp.]|nr:Hsp20/alpha crystallin family protein [Puia sp.]
MTLVKVNNRPFGNLFNELLNEIPVAARSFGQDLLAFPQTNIHETPDAYHLELNAPGRTKEDFKIQVEQGLLTISYEKKESVQSEDYKTVRREFEFRSFKRSFSVDDKINVDGIEAKYENGVLNFFCQRKKNQNRVQSKLI